MSDLDQRLDREEIVEQTVRTVQTGRLAVIVAEQPVCAGLLGDVAVMLMEGGVDVARLDALESHSPDAVRQMLCHAMGLDEGALMEGMRFRGETGNPFCLVIDSGECLDGKTFILLKTLLEQTSGGLGLLLAGDPDLGTFLDDFDFAVSWRYELEPDYPLADEQVEAEPDSGSGFPWKHVAAAAGLALLVVLFWPGDESGVDAEMRTLALPERPETAITDAGVSPAEAAPRRDDEVVSRAVGETPDASAATVDPDLPREAGRGGDVAASDVAGEKILPPAAPSGSVAPTTPSDTPRPSSPAHKLDETGETGVAPKQKPAKQKSAPPATETPAPVLAQDPALSGRAAELNYRGEDWLLAQDADRWVLQVALATTENGARSLLDRVGRDRSAYYRAQRDGRSVYVVVAGPWPDRKSAVDARSSLPQDLRRLGPFPRQMESVQEELQP